MDALKACANSFYLEDRSPLCGASPGWAGPEIQWQVLSIEGVPTYYVFLGDNGPQVVQV